jgi:hypothetical protein
MKTNIIMGALTLTLSAVCAAFAQQPTRPCGPSATEVFHLRTECGDLGRKRIAETVAEVAEYPSRSVAGGDTHYDASTNRCYVKLLIIATNYSSVYLHDAQTMEVLADYQEKGSYQERDSHRALYDGSIRVEHEDIDREFQNAGGDPEFVNWQKAVTFINRIMRPETR